MSENGKLLLEDGRAIAFQLLFALSIAADIGFQHNDLHDKNVMYKKLPVSAPPKQGIAFIDRIEDVDYVWFIKCDFILKVADYGLSRITLAGGEDIGTGKLAHSKEFNTDLDRVKEIITKLKFEKNVIAPELDNFRELKSNVGRIGVSTKDILLFDFFKPQLLEDVDPSKLSLYHQYFGAKHPKRKQKRTSLSRSTSTLISSASTTITTSTSNNTPHSEKTTTTEIESNTNTTPVAPQLLNSSFTLDSEEEIPVKVRRGRKTLNNKH